MYVMSLQAHCPSSFYKWFISASTTLVLARKLGNLTVACMWAALHWAWWINCLDWFFPKALEGSIVTTTPSGRRWRHLPARRAVGGFGHRDIVDVLFWSLLSGFLDITPTLSAHLEARLSTLPSRLSAGIQQRWNGCLKRTIPSVKGVWVVMKQEMILSCHAPSFQFCSLSVDFAIWFHIGSEVHARHGSLQETDVNP